LFEEGTGIRMKSVEGENIFIKYNSTRYVNTSCRDIETFDTFMQGAISEKNTPFRAKSNLACIIRTKVGPTGTTKRTKSIIVGSDVK
jgi:hypothetical protein